MIELNTQNHLKYDVWDDVRCNVWDNVCDNVSNNVWNSVCGTVGKNVMVDLQNHTKLK